MALREGGCIGTLLCGEEGSGAHKHSGFCWICCICCACFNNNNKIGREEEEQLHQLEDHCHQPYLEGTGTRNHLHVLGNHYRVMGAVRTKLRVKYPISSGGTWTPLGYLWWSFLSQLGIKGWDSKQVSCIFFLSSYSIKTGKFLSLPPHNTLVIMWGRDKNLQVFMLYELRKNLPH